MSKVIRPDRKEVSFKFDGLGRRIEKNFDGKRRKFLWNVNIILHEWDELDETIQNITTWVFEGKR